MSDEQQERVSLPDKARNLAKFSWDLIKYIHSSQGEKLTVNDEVYAERVRTCKSCPAYMELENECSECGCYIPMKAKIVLDSCPLNKWTEDREGWEKTFNEIVEDLDKRSKPD